LAEELVELGTEEALESLRPKRVPPRLGEGGTLIRGGGLEGIEKKASEDPKS